MSHSMSHSMSHNLFISTLYIWVYQNGTELADSKAKTGEMKRNLFDEITARKT